MDDQHDPEDGEIDGDPDDPQIVNIFQAREDADELAERLNAEHGHRPFLAHVAPGTDTADREVVTASTIRTTAGRWAVVLVIQADFL